MSSGYERIDPRQMQRLSQRLTEAPAFDQFAPMQPQPRRRDAQRVLERELENINNPLPPGVEENIRRLQRMQRVVPEKFEFWPPPPPGQGPHQVAPDPEPPPPPPPTRSVLRRDNMG